MKKIIFSLSMVLVIVTNAQTSGSARFAEIKKQHKEFKAAEANSVKIFVAAQGSKGLHPLDHRITTVFSATPEFQFAENIVDADYIMDFDLRLLNGGASCKIYMYTKEGEFLFATARTMSNDKTGDLLGKDNDPLQKAFEKCLTKRVLPAFQFIIDPINAKMNVNGVNHSESVVVLRNPEYVKHLKLAQTFELSASSKSKNLKDVSSKHEDVIKKLRLKAGFYHCPVMLITKEIGLDGEGKVTVKAEFYVFEKYTK